MTDNRQLSPSDRRQDYEVSVGHLHVNVQAYDAQDAICEARRKLCHDMPRLWDVISDIGPERFEVTPGSTNQETR